MVLLANMVEVNGIGKHSSLLTVTSTDFHNSFIVRSLLFTLLWFSSQILDYGVSEWYWQTL